MPRTKVRRRRFILLAFTATRAFAFDASVPRRIISVSPNITEILFGVGAFSRVVGVSQFCSYPPEAAKLPRVGGWQTSDVEKILALRPDLVVVSDAQVPFLKDRLNAFALHWLAVPSQSLADVYTAINRIGAATGNVTQAALLCRRVRTSLDALQARTQKLPKRRVLLSVSRTPGTLDELYVATQGSFLIELLTIAGGTSVAAPAPAGYGKISKEAVLALNPEIVIDIVHTAPGALAERAAEVWNDLPELRAVREKHIYPVNDPFVTHPSQFVSHTAELFARLLHPELRSEAHP